MTSQVGLGTHLQRRESCSGKSTSGEEAEFAISAEEILVSDEMKRLSELSVEDRAEIVGLWDAIVRRANEEGARLQAVRHEYFSELIERAQELDRRAGALSRRHDP
jgi:hypothetical protein